MGNVDVDGRIISKQYEGENGLNSSG